jgi:hypothetical protein
MLPLIPIIGGEDRLSQVEALKLGAPVRKKITSLVILNISTRCIHMQAWQQAELSMGLSMGHRATGN